MKILTLYAVNIVWSMLFVEMWVNDAASFKMQKLEWSITVSFMKKKKQTPPRKFSRADS